jgi:hypothetical protein
MDRVAVLALPSHFSGRCNPASRRAKPGAAMMQELLYGFILDRRPEEERQYLDINDKLTLAWLILGVLLTAYAR